jgi:hypothetical protein
MKYLIIFFLLLNTIVYSQKSYPYLMVDSVGDQYIVLTLEQAQKLDNATEFSPTLWKENVAYYKLIDSLCEKKILLKNIEIDSLIVLENNLREQLNLSSDLINKFEDKSKICDSQIVEYQKKVDSEIYNRNQLEDVIKNNQKVIKQQRKEINFAIGFGIITAIISFIASM